MKCSSCAGSRELGRVLQAIHQVELLLDQGGKGSDAVGLDPVRYSRAAADRSRGVARPPSRSNSMATRRDDLAEVPPGHCQEVLVYACVVGYARCLAVGQPAGPGAG